MENIEVKHLNYAKMRIDAAPSVLAELREYFTFQVPGYKFMPAYKNGMWDGKIRLFNMHDRTLLAGLFFKVEEFAETYGHQVVVHDNEKYGAPGDTWEIDDQELTEWIDSLNIKLGGKSIDLSEDRDYQQAAVKYILENRRGIPVSPTGSGKSLIMYLLLRFWIEFAYEEGQRFTIIVPTTTLVKQLYSDFEEYSENNDFKVSNWITQIYSGQDKTTDHPVLITTWQSLKNYPKKFFKTIGGFIGDEAHTCKAKIVSSILESATEAQWRIGTTGTTDGTQTNDLTLQGHMGKIKKMITTEELQKRGVLSDLTIDIIALKYPDADRKLVADLGSYDKEMKVIEEHDRRNRVVAKIASGLEGNTLALFKKIAHGKLIYEMIKERAPNKEVYYIDGGVDPDIRNSMREYAEKNENVIIVASYGTYSTGINIKNLHNIVFAAPYKSQIKVLQSIGRGLRLADNGATTRLIDIVDDLQWKKRKNHAINHSEARIKIYGKERFKFQVIPLTL